MNNAGQLNPISSAVALKGQIIRPKDQLRLIARTELAAAVIIRHQAVVVTGHWIGATRKLLFIADPVTIGIIDAVAEAIHIFIAIDVARINAASIVKVVASTIVACNEPREA